MNNIKYILIALFCFITEITADNVCGFMVPRDLESEWGNGLIVISNIEGLRLFEVINNEFKARGKILEDDRWNEGIHLDSNDTLVVDKSDIEYIGHSTFSYYKGKESHHSEYLQILLNSKQGKFFIQKNELFNQFGDFCTYEEILSESNFNEEILLIKNDAKLGVNLKNNCLNIRKHPTIMSEGIKCIEPNTWNSDKSDINYIEIVEFKDKWAKVMVEICSYIEPNGYGIDEEGDGCPCDNRTIISGWTKAIDDNGWPNIWYAVTSY